MPLPHPTLVVGVSSGPDLTPTPQKSPPPPNPEVRDAPQGEEPDNRVTITLPLCSRSPPRSWSLALLAAW